MRYAIDPPWVFVDRFKFINDNVPVCIICGSCYWKAIGVFVKPFMRRCKMFFLPLYRSILYQGVERMMSFLAGPCMCAMFKYLLAKVRHSCIRSFHYCTFILAYQLVGKRSPFSGHRCQTDFYIMRVFRSGTRIFCTNKQDIQPVVKH